MMVSIGDLAQTFLMKRQTLQAKTDLQRLSTELATGVVSDPAARHRGDLAPLGAIEASLSRLSGFDAVTRDMALVLQARQVALGQVDAVAGQSAARLLAVTQAAATGLDTAGRAVADDFSAAVSALNQRFADRSLFAGAVPDGSALLPAAAILAAAEAAVSAATGPDGLEQALDDWLADPAGFAAQAYRGGDPAPAVAVAPGLAVTGDVTALDAGLRQTFKGLMMGALLSRGVFSGDDAARSHLARRSAEVLAAAATDRAALSARLGTVEGRVAEAEARNSGEATALGIARAAFLQADPYETAASLQEAEARLDLLFTLTARLSRLTLADRL